ncbi:MAG: integration host factor, actinobacterial type [Actinomycetes bacterium]
MNTAREQGGRLVTSMPPVMSTAQRRAALEKAAATRRARAELLALVRAGQLSITDVLARADDDLIAQTRVEDLLRAVPGCDPDTRARALTLAGISDRRRVQGLAPWQRDAVLTTLSQTPPSPTRRVW